MRTFISEKTVYLLIFLRHGAKKFSVVFEKLFDGVLKTAFHVSFGTFCAKNFFEKSITFFYLCCNLSEILSEFFSKSFWQDCRNFNRRVHRNILRKKNFSEKIYTFVIIFELSGKFLWVLGMKTSARLPKLDFTCSEKHFRIIRFEGKIHFFNHFWTLRENLLASSRKFSLGGVKIEHYVSERAI